MWYLESFKNLFLYSFVRKTKSFYRVICECSKGHGLIYWRNVCRVNISEPYISPLLLHTYNILHIQSSWCSSSSNSTTTILLLPIPIFVRNNFMCFYSDNLYDSIACSLKACLACTLYSTQGTKGDRKLLWFFSYILYPEAFSSFDISRYFIFHRHRRYRMEEQSWWLTSSADSKWPFITRILVSKFNAPITYSFALTLGWWLPVIGNVLLKYTYVL